MTTSMEELHRELRQLVSAACDGGLSDRQHVRMEQLLTDHAELRQYYAELVLNDALLEQLTARSRLDFTPPTTPRAPRQLGGQAKSREGSAERPCQGTSRPAPRTRRWPSLALSPSGRGLALAAGLLVAILGGWLWTSRSAPATIVAIDDAVWQDDVDYAIGDNVNHRTLRLQSGAVHLAFSSSAMVAIHGPAEFRVVGAREGYLVEGSLNAYVPPEAAGFTIRTPGLIAEDLGTAFNMVRNAAGAERIQVTEGRVRVRIARGGGDHLATAGQVVGYDPASPQPALRVTDAEESQIATNGPIEFSATHPRSLGFDQFEHDGKAFVFLESVGRRFATPFPVNIMKPGKYVEFNARGGFVAAGTTVDCYLVHCAPRSAQHEVRGSMTFPGQIVGVITDHDRMNATNDQLGSAWTLRCNYIHRGLESTPARSADELFLSADRRTLQVLFRTSAIDQLRVLVRSQ